jgi:hypothetical protein
MAHGMNQRVHAIHFVKEDDATFQEALMTLYQLCCVVVD